MYCHVYNNNTNSHLLNRGHSKSIKELSRHPLCNVELIENSIQFEISTRMFYVFENFDIHPHGSFPIEKWRSINSAINSLANNGTGIRSTVITSRYRSFHSTPIIKIAYPGSLCIEHFESIEISHLQWLELLLLKGEPGDTRDIKNSIHCKTKRITFGWTQKQSLNLQKSRMYGDIAMPYPSFPQFRGKDILPLRLKVELGKIMSISQFYLDRLYEPRYMMNSKLRNELFGIPFGRSFWQFSSSRFEFVTIYVEYSSIVGRHLDYMNAKNESYNVGSSYSYLIFYDLAVYKVTFIMCNRAQIDAFMRIVPSNEST